jgi:hypothetical protein
MFKLNKKPTTLSEQFQNPISKAYKEEQSTPLTHKYMTYRFPGTSIKCDGVKLILRAQCVTGERVWCKLTRQRKLLNKLGQSHRRFNYCSVSQSS